MNRPGQLMLVISRKYNHYREDEDEAKIEAYAEVYKDTEITKIMKNQQSEKEFKPSKVRKKNCCQKLMGVNS